MELPEGFFYLYQNPGWSDWRGDRARDYLRSRKIDDDIGADYKIGATIVGKHRNRVVIPVFAADQRTLLGWSARDYTDTSYLKYQYPSGMKRGDLLFNSYALTVESDDPIFLTEGVFDAISTGPDAVACLGKPNDNQLSMLASTHRPVVILLDGDAWRESMGYALKLSVVRDRVTWVKLPPKTDPGKVLHTMGEEAYSFFAEVGRQAVQSGSPQGIVAVGRTDKPTTYKYLKL